MTSRSTIDLRREDDFFIFTVFHSGTKGGRQVTFLENGVCREKCGEHNLLRGKAKGQCYNFNSRNNRSAFWSENV